ncbi:hypothetical protein VP01_3351g1 [Puccinia sorghi]|uniref:Uncharacterized protein n=1 Tax=Puccinia sorghi TaxID=27349 RepID=A0A0L6UX40_9BASI|nr:hypothetical protein VP01_3351g1 [Puccinia sorghi]
MHTNPLQTTSPTIKVEPPLTCVQCSTLLSQALTAPPSLVISQEQLPLLEDQATTATFSPPQKLDTGHHLTTETDPDSFGEAHIASIDVFNDSETFWDYQMTPDLSQTALAQYNDLDTYLDTLKADATKKKKKKKKT